MNGDGEERRPEPISIREVALARHEYYSSLLDAGFSARQALYLAVFWANDIHMHPDPPDA